MPQHLLNVPATEVSALSNGLKVASESSHSETATVGVWIDAGSRYESPETNGVAHFLEHMAFKGTQKRTQRQLEVEIENIGGHLNAYTSREQTVYYAKVFKSDVPQAMDILGDILNNALYEESAIERERGVILREMEEVNKQPEEVIFDMLHETAYQKQGLGQTILGPVENIKSLSRSDLVTYVKDHYHAHRVVVAGAGGVDHAQLASLANDHFGHLPATQEPQENPLTLEGSKDKAHFTGSDIRVRNDADGLAHIAIAFECAGWTSPHSFPLMIMQTILGSWDRTSGSGANMASVLCGNVADQEAANSVSTFCTQYKDTGLFGVYGVVPEMRNDDFVWIAMESLLSLVHNTSEDEVARAKVQLKASLLAQLDGSSPVCEDIGRQMLTYGRRITPAEVFARIDAVDAAAVKATADLFINDQDVAVAASGAIHELPDYNKFRRYTYRLRN